jgi:hypothetical protein
MLGACSTPGVATPLPEPPSLDARKITAPEVTPVTAPSPVEIVGAVGAATARAVVRATNLDTTDPAVTTTADDNGAFHITIMASGGNELRVQAIAGNERSAPLDLTYTAGRIAPSVRSACVALSPGFELDFSSSGPVRLTFTNSCADAITLANPRLRLGLTDFQLTTALPLSIGTGASSPLDVTYARTDAGDREDVLFVTITVAGQDLRYPITLFAPAIAP